MLAACAYDLDPAWPDAANDNARRVDNIVGLFSAVWDADRRLTMQIEAQVAGSPTRPATRNTYDTDGQLTQKSVGPMGSGGFTASQTTQFAYDAAGDKIQDTVLNGTATPALSATQTSYDADDRPVCTAVRMNPAVYSALPNACVLSTANPLTGIGPDQIVAKIYDTAGQVTQEQRGVGTAHPISYALYTYSPDGKQASVTDADNNLTAFVYDGWDRLVTEQFPSKTPGALASDPADYEAYTYDANDNRLTVRRRDGSVITHAYDALNREISRMGAVSCGATTGVYTTYDLASRKTSVNCGSPTGLGVVGYGYDSAGRLSGETTLMGTIGYGYDGANNRTSITYPNSSTQGPMVAGYAYDALNHVTAITTNGAAAASYSYDGLGRRTGITRPNASSTTYAYDNADRLTSLAHVFPNAAFNLSQTLSYDPGSELVGVANTNTLYLAGLPTAKTYAANGLNQDAAIAAISGGGYDGRGNEVNDGTRVFTYDAENKLLSGSAPTAIAVAYDPAGRLYQYAAGAGAPTQFLYAGSDLIAEYQSGNLLRRYIPGPGTDEPLVWFEYGVATRWLYADHQGSIIAQADNTSTGNVAAYTYGPYGEPNSWAGSRFRYTGQIAIPEAQLYHYKARVYDPIAGRFLQTDPVGYDDDLNTYRYVANDPVNLTDPSGEMGGGLAAGDGATMVGELVVTGAEKFVPDTIKALTFASDIDPIQLFLQVATYSGGLATNDTTLAPCNSGASCAASVDKEQGKKKGKAKAKPKASVVGYPPKDPLAGTTPTVGVSPPPPPPPPPGSLREVIADFFSYFRQ